MLTRSSVQIYEADNIAHYLPETDGASSSLILVFKEDCFICELSRSIIRFLESSSIWKRRNSLSTSFVSQRHILLYSQKGASWPEVDLHLRFCFLFFYGVLFEARWGYKCTQSRFWRGSKNLRKISGWDQMKVSRHWINEDVVGALTTTPARLPKGCSIDVHPSSYKPQQTELDFENENRSLKCKPCKVVSHAVHVALGP